MCFNFKWSKCLKPAVAKKGNSIIIPAWSLHEGLAKETQGNVHKYPIKMSSLISVSNFLQVNNTIWPSPRRHGLGRTQPPSFYLKLQLTSRTDRTLAWLVTHGVEQPGLFAPLKLAPGQRIPIALTWTVLWSCVLNNSSKYGGHFGVLTQWDDEWRDLLLYGRQ